MRCLISCTWLTRWFCVVTLLLVGHVLLLCLVQAQAITPVHTKLTPDTDTGGFGLYDVAPDASHVVYMAA